LETVRRLIGMETIDGTAGPREQTLELDGQARPACVAWSVVVYYD